MGGRGGEAAELGAEGVEDVGGGGEKLLGGLLAAAEGDVVAGVLAGAAVPVGAHLVVDVHNLVR